MQRASIDAVIFDAGGVLLHPNLDWLSEQLAALGVTRDRNALHHDYYRMIHAADLDPTVDRRGVALTTLEMRIWMVEKLLSGVVASGQLEPGQLEALAPELARRAAARFPGEGDIFFWAMPGLRPRLERLRATGLTLGVASNNDGSLAGQLAAVGVADLFDAALDSAVEGVSKPDPELLLRASSALDIEARRCLYVGDIDRVDGAAARAAGMHFALLDPLNQPRPGGARGMPLCIPSIDAILEHFRNARDPAAPKGGDSRRDAAGG